MVDGESGADRSQTTTPESPLRGALDRFAQFFICPLFLKEALDRELKSVDSENKKNLQSDTWRFTQLDKSLSNPNHPHQHFSTGNLKTLRDEPQERGVEVRDEFMKFHEKHYSANRMKLVVLGTESLDELESWVVELFADVPNKDLLQNRWDDVQPYTEKELLKQVFAKPVMDSRSLKILFPYQDEESLYKSYPSRYLSHLIGHEGPGSILAYIKAKGWATGLSAGPMTICPGAGSFHIAIRLTKEGLSSYQEVLKAVFQYIALMKEIKPQKWIVDEIKGMAEVDFRFKQKVPASSFTSSLSSTMQKPLPREWLLAGQRMIREFDSDAISHAMSHLRADNYKITIASQEYPGSWDMRERWYGTEYKVEPIPKDVQESMRRAIESTPESRPQELHLPHKNEFIPTRLAVERKEVPEPMKAPKLIRNDENVRAWWKKDDRFWVPKGSLIALLRTPLTAVTPENYVKTALYRHLVKDALDEYSYDAEIAGLAYQIGASGIGLTVKVSGYNDKMPVLLEKVLVGMRDLEINSDRFQIMKDRLLRSYRNWEFQQPFHQVGDFTNWLRTERSWINEQLLAEIHHLTPGDISIFYPQLLNQLHIEVLCHGNLYKEDALRMTKLIETTLKARPLPRAQWHVRRHLLLPEGSDYTYRRPLGDPANINNCIEYYVHGGSISDKQLGAKILLLAQLGDEQGFDQLRTKEQLGYIVFTGHKTSATTVGYRVVIQSERPTEYLEERINAFLLTLGQTLENMSQQEFDGHKRSVINKRLEKLKSLDQETNRFWSQIANEHYHFQYVDSDVEHLRPLSKADMVEFFNHYIHPSSPHRAKLSVHLVAKTSPKEVAGSMSVETQKDKVLNLMAKYLTAGGVSADPEQLSKQFADVDIAEGDRVAIANALSKYLNEDAGVPSEQINLILEQSEQLLSTVLPGLGIEVTSLPSDDKDLPKAPQMKQTTFIENVPEYKASLEVGAGPRPIVNIREYEDLEPKL